MQTLRLCSKLKLALVANKRQWEDCANDYGISVRLGLVKGATNFAFLGQFAEAPKDCVFTVEYSTRTAQMAVYGLFETAKQVMPVYDAIHNPLFLIKAAQSLARQKFSCSK